MTKPKAPPKTGWLVWDSSGYDSFIAVRPTRDRAVWSKSILTEGGTGKWKISKVRITVIKK
jgi:hypothetical protein